MKKVATYKNYNYWLGIDEKGNTFYNITPIDQKPPNGGYCKEWILGIKKVPDLFP